MYKNYPYQKRRKKKSFNSARCII